MHTRFATAFRAAVLLTALVAGCNDAPLAPHQRSSAPTVATAGDPHTRAFSGAQADSVLNVLEAGWARSGHPEYRQSRLAWRKTNGVPDSVHVPGPRDTLVMTAPNAYLYGEETLRPPPQILSHFEALHFGYHDSYTNVPDGVEGEATFIGDQADITVGSITFTGNSGSTSTLSGRIAMGPGQIIGCTDVTFGSCDNRRHLNGVLILDAAPTCDAKGSGTVNYYISNISPPISVNYSPTIGSAGNSDQSASAVASVSSSGGPCPSDGGQHNPSTDSTSNTPPTPPPGSPAGPPPGYDGPGVPPLPPSYPPPRIDGGLQDFWCERVDTYQYIGGQRTLFTTEIYCYRSV